MTNVNKKYLKEALKRKAWGEFALELKRAQYSDQLEKVMARWLTASELMMLEKRLAIKVLLAQGIRHNAVKRILDISSHTITSLKRRNK